MTQPDQQIDADKLLQRAYTRVAELTMQNDQLAVAYEAQNLELARVREDLATERAKHRQPAEQTSSNGRHPVTVDG